LTTMMRGFVLPSLPINRYYLGPRLVPLALPTVLLGVLVLRFTRTRRQRLVTMAPLAGIVLFALIQAVGCGGAGSVAPPPPLPTGTPAGTYTVTVTGTSGNITHTTTLTLTVN
jgi:hypothetical protein